MKQIDKIIKKINEALKEQGCQYLSDGNGSVDALADYETRKGNTIEVELDDTETSVIIYHANQNRRKNDGDCPRLAEYIRSRIIATDDIKQEYRDWVRQDYEYDMTLNTIYGTCTHL